MTSIKYPLCQLQVPSRYWKDQLYGVGLNTIQTYIPWNFHETVPSVFDFEGDKNLEWDSTRKRPSSCVKTWVLYWCLMGYGWSAKLVADGEYYTVYFQSCLSWSLEVCSVTKSLCSLIQKWRSKHNCASWKEIRQLLCLRQGLHAPLGKHISEAAWWRCCFVYNWWCSWKLPQMRNTSFPLLSILIMSDLPTFFNVQQDYKPHGPLVS